MAVANSLHEQYLGHAKGEGLLACFNLLNRKGLHKTSTEGPFHAHLNEALHHIAEAHFREIWSMLAREQGGTVAGLRSKSPSDLIALSNRALQEYASSAALEDMRAKRDADQDHVQQLHTQFAQDVLPYLSLVAAVKRGDVGMLEALLPTFLFRFIGGGNTNYQEMTIELLNGLNKDWPSDVADFVRNNCWLLTFTGRPESYVSFDQAQEHNIKDIKATYKPPGPRGGWEYMHTLHPAIPTIRENSEFIDQAFNTLTRGKKHTSPKKEGDIQKLLEQFQGVHGFVVGRQVSPEDKSENYFEAGGEKWMGGSVRQNWKDKRQFERSTEEKYVARGEESDVSNNGSSQLGTEE
ncbi:hypothetical protein C8F01DRAFT_994622 [Mycena amicta]|nr:hypothetical protein C8F01DRAFT_994622 [Mycena amicta]